MSISYSFVSHEELLIKDSFLKKRQEIFPRITEVIEYTIYEFTICIVEKDLKIFS